MKAKSKTTVKTSYAICINNHGWLPANEYSKYGEGKYDLNACLEHIQETKKADHGEYTDYWRNQVKYTIEKTVMIVETIDIE
jgi:hypothetical protein